MSTPLDASDRLPQPTAEEMDLAAVLNALGDPVRLAIVHRYLVDAAGGTRHYGWVGINRPKSTLTHHFRVLREAGIVEQHQEGLGRWTRVRTEDLDQRFPASFPSLPPGRCRTGSSAPTSPADSRRPTSKSPMHWVLLLTVATVLVGVLSGWLRF